MNKKINVYEIKRNLLANNHEILAKIGLIHDLELSGIKLLEQTKNINEYVISLFNDTETIFVRKNRFNTENDLYLYDKLINLFQLEILDYKSLEYKNDTSKTKHEFNSAGFILYRTKNLSLSEEDIKIVEDTLNNHNLDLDIMYLEKLEKA